jgi:aspartyl-tRNA synthetase
MSFVEQKDILDLTESLFTSATEKLTDKKILNKPWPRLTYNEVMLKYGTDKPDLRFGLEIIDITKTVKGCSFSVFAKVVESGGVVRALTATGGAKLTRSEIDKLTDFVKEFGAKGLAYIVVGKTGNHKSPIIKFLGDNLTERIVDQMKAKKGDIIFFGADKESVVCESLGQLRNELGKKLKLIDPNVLAFCFVIDFPLFEPELEDGHFAPMHHMFTMPKEEDWNKLTLQKARDVKSYQHDMVLNGIEVGGGSIRIHRPDIQEKTFNLIGFKKDRIKFFHHMLEAFTYGAPPHGGIAFGIERMLALFLDEDNIREVTAFPKNQKAQDLMMGAPDDVEPEQLSELHLKVEKD